MRSCLVLALVLAVFAAGRPGRAETETPDERARALYHDYMSPYCPGLLLAECSSRPAATLRSEIREALAGGTPEAEVRAALERRFGERILAAPPRRGFGLVAWSAPYVGVGAALAAVVVWCRRRIRGSPPTAVARAAPADPALRARLEAELRRF